MVYIIISIVQMASCNFSPTFVNMVVIFKKSKIHKSFQVFSTIKLHQMHEKIKSMFFKST